MTKPTGRPPGRPKGSRTKKTRDIAERALAAGYEPLEVMIKAMRVAVDAGAWDKAADLASKCAPYCHPKLNAVEVSGKDGGPIEWSRKTPAELEQALYDEYLSLGLSDDKARALAGAASSPDDGEGAGAPGVVTH